MVVGVPYHTVGSNEFQGAVYVFTMPASGWGERDANRRVAASDVRKKTGSATRSRSRATSSSLARPNTLSARTRTGRGIRLTMPASGWASETENQRVDRHRWRQIR